MNGELTKLIEDLRYRMHRSIVHLAIKSAANGKNLDVELIKPLEVSYKTTNDMKRVTVEVKVTGINGTTGELIAENLEGENIKLYYNDLTLEEMARLNEYLESKLFLLTEKYDRNLITIS